MPNEPEVAEASKTIDGKSVCKIRFYRDNEVGLQIELQSNTNWHFLSNKDDATIKIGGVKCFKPKQQEIEGVPGYFWSQNVFEYGGFPNLNILLAENLNNNEVVTFKFGFLPISNEKTVDWIKKFKEQVKILYLTYCKPINHTIEINSKTIENETHD